MKIPTVCIVGRPNVGKSSLFNRLVGTRASVVERERGTTRDRVEKTVELDGMPVRFIDTGGFLTCDKDRINMLVREQISGAVRYSDLIIFACDCVSGATAEDMELVPYLRKAGKKVILVVNKADNEKRKDDAVSFYELGLGEPHAVSCLHNIGIDALKESIAGEVKEMYPEAPSSSETAPIKVSIVGRPNVGKSSLLNKLLNEERMIVDERPGTTRDSIDTYFTAGATEFMLIDTAGMRHKRKVKKAVDLYGMMRSKEAVMRSDIAVLVIDGMEGVADDDAKILDFIISEGKGCVVCVNKWDLVKNIPTAKYKQQVIRKIPEARNLPIIFVSAKTARNVSDIIETARIVKTNMDLSINQEDLEKMLADIKPELLPVPQGYKGVKFYGMKLVKLMPKTFCLFVKNPRLVLDMHRRFIENNLRIRFPLAGVPVRIVYKKK